MVQLGKEYHNRNEDREEDSDMKKFVLDGMLMIIDEEATVSIGNAVVAADAPIANDFANILKFCHLLDKLYPDKSLPGYDILLKNFAHY